MIMPPMRHMSRADSATLSAGAVAVQGQEREDSRDGRQVRIFVGPASWDGDVCPQLMRVLPWTGRIMCTLLRQTCQHALWEICEKTGALLSRARASQRREGPAVPRPRSDVGVRLQDGGLGGERQVGGQAVGRRTYHTRLRRVRGRAPVACLALWHASQRCGGRCSARNMRRCMPRQSQGRARGAGRRTWRGTSTASRPMWPLSSSARSAVRPVAARHLLSAVCGLGDRQRACKQAAPCCGVRPCSDCVWRAPGHGASWAVLGAAVLLWRKSARMAGMLT